MVLKNIIFMMAVLVAVGVSAEQGYYREVYNNITGTDIVNLTGAAKYPGYPDEDQVVNSQLETPINIGDNYGQRLRAWITPDVTTNYLFYIATDDEGHLYLSTDDTPENKVLVAWVDGWTPSRDWYREPANQQSDPIHLTAGNRYYLEVLQKEGGGGDNCAVGWHYQGGSVVEIIAARFLEPFLPLPEIRTQPQSVEVFEQYAGIQVVSFSVEATRDSGVGYQWQTNGVDIAGATEPVYSLIADAAGSNRIFRCVLTSPGGSVISDEVMYSIIPDNEPPTLESVRSFRDRFVLVLVFSEPLDAVSAGNPANYSIAGNGVTGVRLIAESNAVVLTLASALQPGAAVSLSFSVDDQADPPNTLAVSGYSYTPPLLGVVPQMLVHGADEPAGPSSRRTQIAITEIQHTPELRTDGRDLRFLEIHNGDPFYIDISGYRFSGAFDFEVPQGTVIPAKGYLVLAPVPADISAVYGISGVLGGFDAAGFDGTSSITLEDELGAWLTTINYSDDPPWPAASDGTGHSLVLKRPSLGEPYVEAWGVSAYRGGSPGAADPVIAHGFEGVLFNEVLAHPGGGDGFVEFYNFSANPVDLSGCVLKEESPASAGCTLPPGSVVPAGGYLALTESQCGFYINGRGDKLYLYAPEGMGGMVVAALEFDDQEAGVAFGCTPDGGPCWNRLLEATPGAANAGRRPAVVIINEIMYHPLSESSEHEYIELHNTSTNAIPLSGWRLGGDIAFDFTSESIDAGGYLVIPRELQAFTELYPAVSNVAAGGYSGNLPNKRGSIRLERPAFVMDTNDGGAPVVKEKNVVIESVTYKDGGNWHRKADGMGSSLERVDPRLDPALASAWQASDETEKSDWVTLEFTGKIDHGFTNSNGEPNEVHIGLMDSGECLIDSVEVFQEGGANLVNNASFESDTMDWRFMGTHDACEIIESAGAFNGDRVLHLVANGRIHTGENCVRGAMSASLPKSGTGTIRVRARWLSGMPELLVRTRGNWLEACGGIVTNLRLGSPGAVNSGRPENAPPAITGVIHQPLLPRNGEAVGVYARVDDPDGLLDVRLYYRVDGVEAVYSVVMQPCSAGYYRGEIPAGQPDNALIAFYVEARDIGAPVLTAAFPSSAPQRECLVRYNEPLAERGFGIYRFWISQKNYDYWKNRETGSNRPVDITFLYNGRPVYEAGIMYAGSPFHSNYTEPINNGNIDYKIEFQGDDEVLDSGRLILATLGNLGSDNVGIKEQFNYELVRALGLAYPRRRYVHLYANGSEQSGYKILEDTEKPNKAYIERWFSEDPDRDFFKVDDWFEYTLDLESQQNVNATLQQFWTDAPDGDGQILKLGRYRWNWQKRGEENFRNNDYTNFFGLVTALNVADAQTYSALVREVIDIEAFAGVIAMNHYICNWDTYGYNRGKNMFLFDAVSGWSLVAWDLDFQFQSENLWLPMNPFNGSFPVNDPTMRTFLRNPQVTRAYWRAVMDVMEASKDSAVRAFVRAKYDALKGDYTSLNGSYENHFTLVDQRYATVATELAALNPTAFSVTSPGSAISYSGENVMSISGSAPFEAVSVLVNGVEAPVTWLSATTWSLDVVLNGGTNTFSFSALDRDGVAVNGAPVTRQLVYTGPALDPMDKFLVISEIMTLPVTNDAEYVEIYNASAGTVMNLSGLYVKGSIEYTFPSGTYLAPGESCLLVESMEVFAAVYPAEAVERVVGRYSGRVSSSGGSVVLMRPAAGFELADVVIDRVDYGAGFPWPAAVIAGASLQLSNPLIEGWHPANWVLSTNSQIAVTNTAAEWSAVWRYYTAGYPGSGWNADGFNDAGWPTGPGPLGQETGTVLPVPLATSFPLTGQTAYYFRSAFTYSGDASKARLLLRYMLDDGAVFYLNGTEIHRSSLMPQGEITESSVAVNYKMPEGEIEGPFVIDSHPLREGLNTLAVSVHQNQAASSDLVFGMKMDIVSPGQNLSSPGLPNVIVDPLDELAEISLNEIQPLNMTGPMDGEGEHEPWLELYNGGTSAVSMAGWRLVRNESDPGWAFPDETLIDAGGFLRVWMDGEVPPVQDPAGPHASFRCDLPSGALALLDSNGVVVDFLEFETLGADEPFGCWPDGHRFDRRSLNPATPQASNRIDKRNECVVINEFMADNGLFTNPLSGDQDDWFELYNDGMAEVDLGGWMITDTLAGSAPPVPAISKTFTVPSGITLRPGEALRIWTGADNAGALPFDPDNLQAPFGLSRNGDNLYLFNAATALVDHVAYAVEDDDDDSIGRWVNGEKGGWVVLDEPTPGLPNRNPLFGAGYIRQPPAFTIPERVAFAYTNGFDSVPPAGFEFRLFATEGQSLPSGLVFDQTGGVINWTPAEEQGPGLYEFDLVGYVVDGVTVTACDHLPLTIRVEERVSAPRLDPIAPIAVSEGALVAFSVNVHRDVEIPFYETFTDLRLEGDVPSNAVFDAQSGGFSWQTAEIDGPCVRHITIVAEDSVTPEIRCETAVTVTVSEVNSGFTYASPSTFYLWNNEDFAVQLVHNDPDIPPNDFSYVLIYGPEGCALDFETGVLRWQPAPGYAGSQSVRFRAYDNAGATRLTTISLNVSALQFTAGSLAVQPDGAVRLEWLSRLYTSYVVEWSASLDSAEWQAVNPDEPVSGTGGEVSYTVDPSVIGSPAKAFFRLRQIR